MDAFSTIASDVLTVKRSVPAAVLLEQDTPGGSIFLSSIDNVALAIMSTVYSFDRSDVNVAGVIKQPLSKVLVYYYPPAGRLAKNSQGKFTVDCQKKFGVPFVEGSANCDIEKLGGIQIMDPDILGKLVYRDPTENMLEVGPLVTAQVNNFFLFLLVMIADTLHSVFFRFLIYYNGEYVLVLLNSHGTRKFHVPYASLMQFVTSIKIRVYLFIINALTFSNVVGEFSFGKSHLIIN